MSKEISLDSRFEDIFNNRQRSPKLYNRLKILTETTVSIPEVHPIQNIDLSVLGFEEDKSYAPNDVAALLGVRPATVRRWIRDGELPATKVGKKLLYVNGSDLGKILKST